METKVEVSVAGVEYMTEGMLEMGVHTGVKGYHTTPITLNINRVRIAATRTYEKEVGWDYHLSLGKRQGGSEGLEQK